MGNRSIFHLLLGALLLITTVIKAQLSGTVTVPGTYASLSAALVDLNAQGVNGPLTVAVQAGYTETVTAGGFSLTATGTVANPITFIKSGAGANPLLISYTGGSGTPATAVQDGVWRLIGSDYITIDGIDIFDQNTSNPATMEFGYGFFKTNPGNGCQYNLIQNCTITLRTINNTAGAASASDGSRGINVVNALATAQTSNLSPFAANGSNSFNRFYSNTISDCNIGIAIIGFAAPSPYTFADAGNEIGGLLAATANTIINFGGASAAVNPAAGIRVSAQYSLTIAGNQVNNNNGAGINHPAALRGIFLLPATGASAMVLNNTISLKAGNGTQTLAAIENQSGAGAGTFVAQGNLIVSTSYSVGTSGACFGIYNNQASVSFLNISDNVFDSFSASSSTGNVFLIYNNATLSGPCTYSNNNFSLITHTVSSSGSFFGIWNAGAVTGNLVLSANSFSACNLQQSTGGVNLILNTGATSGTITMNANSVRSFSATANNSGTLSLIYNNAANAALLSLSNNTIQNSFFNNNSGAYHLLYNRGAGTNSISSIFMENNLLSSITQSSSANGGVFSIWNNGMTSTLSSVSSNTIIACEWRTTGSLRYLLSHWGAADRIQVDANLISTCTGTNGTTGAINCILVNNPGSLSSGTLAVTSNTLSNLNFSTTTGDQFYIQNTGVTTNTYALIQLQQNLITSNSATSSSGGHYAIYNNAASALELSILSNTLTASSFNVTNGAVIHLYNRSITGSFFGSTTFSLNTVQTNTYFATAAGNLQLIANTAPANSTCNQVRIATNRLSNLLFNTLTASYYGVLNTAAATGTLAIEGNLFSDISHAQNQTALLITIQNNGSAGTELSIRSNTIINNLSSASTGPRYGIYNLGAFPLAANINENLFSGFSHSVSSSGLLAYIFNSSPTSGLLRMNSNTITACNSSLQNGATYLIYNSSAATNTIADLRMEENLISASTASSGTGAFYGIFNNLNSSTLTSISSNTLINLVTNGLSNSKFFIMNSGVTSSSLVLNSNLLTACSWTQNTSGSFYGIYNTGIAVELTAQTNTLSNLQSAASTGSVFGIFNNALVSTLLNVSTNSLQQFTNTATGSGYFAGIQNAGVVSGTLGVSSNRLEDLVLQTTSGSSHLICNRGISTATINTGVIANNRITNILHSSTTGSFSAIFNNNFTSTNFAISGNSVTAVSITGTASPRSFIFNSGNVNVNLNLTNNLISQNIYTILPNSLNTLLFNTGNSSSNINITGNRIFSNQITSSLAAVSLMHNSGTASQSLQITNNALSQNSIVILGSGNANVLLNTSAGGSSLAINTNTVSGNTISNSGNGLIQVISNSRTGNNSSANSELDANAIQSNTLQSVTGAVFVCGNNGLTAQLSDVSGNLIQNNLVSGGSGSIVGVHNTAGLNQTVTINSNLFSGNLFSGTGLLVTAQETGTSGAVSMNTNTITASVLGALSTRYLVNSASVSGDVQMNQNVIASNSQTSTAAGSFCGILNTSAVNGNCSLNSNIFQSNSTAAFTASVGLVYNAGTINGLLQINNNALSQTFLATANGFAGNLSAIVNQGGSASGTLAVLQNTFSNFIFNAGGNGNIDFISNFNNPLATTITGNLWAGLVLNHSGQQQLIYNDAVQGLSAVTNNSITSGYQVTASAGTIRLYCDGGGLSGSGRQVISDNNFSNIQSNITGFGSFYGIYSKNAVSSKSITANIISNINLNANGFMYLISADYLNDDNGTAVSVINSNTLTNVFWQGPFYGIEAGPSMGTSLAARIHDNSILTVTTSAGFFGSAGMAVNSSSAGVLVYRNSIADLQEISNIGTLTGLQINSGSYVRAYNNLIGNLRTPTSLISESENGIKVAGTGLTEIYYNSVYLNGAATGSNTGSNCLFKTGTGTLDLRNNCLVNLRQSANSGVNAVLRNASAGSGGISVTSNYNLLYAGVPSPGRVIYATPSSDFSLWTAYQNAVTPRDLNSVSEAPVFQSTLSNTAFFLHLNPSVSSLAESGAVAIASISDDVDLDIRQAAANYTGTGTSPDIGADEFETVLLPCSSAMAGTIASAVGTVICEGQPVYLYANGFSTDGGISYQWKSSASATGPFLPVASGTRPVLITPTLSSGIYYFVFEVSCQNGPVSNTSAIYTLQVNAMLGATAVAAPSVVCAGASVTLSALSSSGSVMFWNGPGGYTSSASAAVLQNIATNAAGSYTLVSNLAGCTSSAVAFVSVSIAPPDFQLSPSSASICSGFSLLAQATIPVTTPTLIGGTQSAQNSNASYPAPYSAYYGGQKMQFLIRASELSAAGFTIGTPLTDIRFPVVSLGSGWGNQIQSCQNFQLAIKATTLSTLSQFENNLTVVMPAANFTPTPGYSNTHVFSVPFVWDGASNLILETVFSNSIIGNAAFSVIQNIHNCGFQSTQLFRADNLSFSALSAVSATNLAVNFMRPDFRLNGQSVGTYSWSPATYLSGTNGPSAIVTPSTSTAYTVTLNNGNCSSSAAFLVSVYSLPVLTITATSTSVCAGNTATLFASGAPNFLWNNGATTTSIIANPLNATSYTVQGSNGFCPAVSSVFSLTPLPALTLAVVASASVICAGQSAVLTGTGAQNYSWGPGFSTTSISISPSVTTAYTLNGTAGSGCSASRNFTVRVNPLPVIFVSSNMASVCPGQETRLTAIGASSYTWFPDLKIGSQLTSFPQSSVVYTVTGKDANTCVNSATVAVSVLDCTGLQTEKIGEEMRVYPNPFQNQVTIAFPTAEKRTVTLYTAEGKTILLFSTQEPGLLLSTGELAKGLYLLRISTDRGDVLVRLTRD